MHRESIWFVFGFENCHCVLFIFKIVVMCCNGLPWQSLCAICLYCTEIVQSLCLVGQVKIKHNWKLVKNAATIIRSYKLNVQEKIRIVSFGSATDVGLLNGMMIRRAMNLMTLEGWKIEIWMRINLISY